MRISDWSSDVCSSDLPLSFSLARPAVRGPAGKGALPGPVTEGPLPTPVPGALTAWCDGGVLRIIPRRGLFVERLPGGNLHMNDIAFFWGDRKSIRLITSQKCESRMPSSV